MLVSAAVMDLIAGRLDQPIEELGPLSLTTSAGRCMPIWSGAGAGRARGATAPAVDSFQRRRPSIAVLPFVDRAAEGGATWFSDGLVEDIISACRACPS